LVILLALLLLIYFWTWGNKMSDRLKFRVWDKRKKVYLTDGFLVSPKGEVYKMLSPTMNGVPIVILPNQEDFIVEQGTDF